MGSRLSWAQWPISLTLQRPLICIRQAVSNIKAEHMSNWLCGNTQPRNSDYFWSYSSSPCLFQKGGHKDLIMTATETRQRKRGSLPATESDPWPSSVPSAWMAASMSTWIRCHRVCLLEPTRSKARTAPPSYSPSLTHSSLFNWGHR